MSNSGPTLAELEEKILLLERVNFDLKMRVFYLNNRLVSSDKEGSVPTNIAERVVDLMRDRDMASQQLKEAYNAAMRRIAELESELTQLKIKVGVNEASTRRDSFVQTAKSSASATELLETLKRERQAALAIAEHDAEVIMSLEKELKQLRNRHESDMVLISECAQRESKIKDELNRTKDELVEKNSQLESAKELIDIIEDRMKSGTLQIPTIRKNSSPLRHHSNQNEERSNIMDSNQYTPDNKYNPDHRTNRIDSYNSRNTPQNPGASQLPSTEDLRHASIYGNINKNIMNAAQYLESGQRLQSPLPPEPYNTLLNSFQTPSIQQQIELEKRKLSHEMNIEPLPDLSRPLVQEALAGEILVLRKENAQLKTQAESDREARELQEKTLQQVRDSAEELALLEAEEIARLESELDRCQSEKEKWCNMCKKAEARVESLSIDMANLQRSWEDAELVRVELERRRHLALPSSSPSAHSRSSPKRFDDTMTPSRASVATMSGTDDHRNRSFRSGVDAGTSLMIQKKLWDEVRDFENQTPSSAMPPSQQRVFVESAMRGQDDRRTSSASGNGRSFSSPSVRFQIQSDVDRERERQSWRTGSVHGEYPSNTPDTPYASMNVRAKSPLSPDVSMGMGDRVHYSANKDFNHTEKAIDRTESPADDHLVGMYRKREEELLLALEGVVKRCKNLESRLGLS